MRTPELLAPAGNLEKVKTAIRYGADAVYVGGQRYGLRASADNFTEAEFELAVRFAHQHNKKLYVALNAFFHDEDFTAFAAYCSFLEKIGVDAVIISDPGVFARVREIAPRLRCHISTQASCVNSFEAGWWKEQGAARVVLGRETSLVEARSITERAGVEVELFIHGAMCMAYSGRCTISNFTAGRDSNRGGCIQSCRFPYEQKLPGPKGFVGSHFMSSKDLCGLELIPDFVQQGVHSVKIEGRMKSLLYVATVVSVYRQAIDAYREGAWSEDLVMTLRERLDAFPHRLYTQGSLKEAAGSDSVFFGQQAPKRQTEKGFVGMVRACTGKKIAFEVLSPINEHDAIEILTFQGEEVVLEQDSLRDVDGQPLRSVRQGAIAWAQCNHPGVKIGSIVRAALGARAVAADFPQEAYAV